MLWLRDFFVSFLFLAVAPKLAEADGQSSSWNAKVHAATEVDPPTSPASPSDPEAVSTEKSRPSQISEKSLAVPEEEPKTARGQSAARDAFLFPGESADLSFASGSLSYIECEEASGAGHIPQSADPSTLPLSSPPSTPSFLSFHQPNSSRETRLSLPVFPPRLACAAKKVPSAEVGKEVLSAAAACSAAFAARRASDWEKVEAFNKKLAGLGLAEGPQRLAPLTHVVPTGMGAPVTRRSSFLYWAKSCLFPGVGGDVCFAAVWCTDGIRTASELAIDTTGDIRLLIGERVVLLAGVTGVFSRCEEGGLCQKAKFVGQVEKTAAGDPDDSRAGCAPRFIRWELRPFGLSIPNLRGYPKSLFDLRCTSVNRHID
ncbi:hypothetical protein TGVAND_240200 [Toxoplasma gondii VAND]|uniref:Transmembrane protein n=1 Tax=Toxoplasma gondii VAND TaxID=933077 RepID=A0A086PV89_TOXGO|nr:hypothetical protein TGVAND_240200 [Toxoplasma gondii VAND]